MKSVKPLDAVVEFFSHFFAAEIVEPIDLQPQPIDFFSLLFTYSADLEYLLFIYNTSLEYLAHIINFTSGEDKQ